MPPISNTLAEPTLAQSDLTAFGPGPWPNWPRNASATPSPSGCSGLGWDLDAIAHPKVATTLRFILEQGCTPISLKDLEAVSGLSRRGLHKAFIEHTGSSPGRMMRCVRMERAKHLLAQPRLKLQALARQCGYKKMNSFYVAFKHYTGMSTRQFRESLRATSQQR